MTGPSRTFLVECYAPGIDEAAVVLAAARVRDVVAQLVGGDALIEYGCAVLVAGDEVVFHTFAADDPGVVEQACRLARLGHERIVESVVVAPSQSLTADEPPGARADATRR